ncbi:MAG TPA: hypothetical protein VFJ97_06620 [Dermatophilaceae bacterium]|nr:hypothetical protein [Dermatophilaceae bacterium]
MKLLAALCAVALLGVLVRRCADQVGRTDVASSWRKFNPFEAALICAVVVLLVPQAVGLLT